MAEFVGWAIAVVCTAAMVAAAVPVVRHIRAVRLDGRQPSEDTREGILAAASEPTRDELRALLSEALLMLEHGERPPGAPTDPDRETWYGWLTRVRTALEAAPVAVPDA